MNSYSPFTQRQTNYLHKCDTSWFNVAEGGKRGGKNVLNTLAWCIDLETHPDRFHLVAGVDKSSARVNVLECDGFGVKNYFENRHRIGKFENKDCMYVQTKVGQKIIFFAGGKKAGDDSYIKGYTYGTAYVTEANECHMDFLQEVFDRTISSNRRKVYHDLNPKSPNHAYYKDVLDFHEAQQQHDELYGYNWAKFTLLDNLSISDDKLRDVLKTYDKGTVHWDRDIMGNRKQAEGLIYKRFANDPIKFRIDADKLPRFHRISVGVDFGGGSSNYAWVATGHTLDNSIVALASDRHMLADKTPQEVEAKIIEFCRRVEAKYGTISYIFPDVAQTSLCVGLREAINKALPHISVRIDGGKEPIEDRISVTVRLMGAEKFWYTDDCETLKDALEQAVWDKRAGELTGKDVRLDNGTTPIDDLDSLEYSFSRWIRDYDKRLI